MEKAKTPKAFVNVKDVGFAVIDKDEQGEIKYKEPIQTRGLQEVGVETGGDVATAYADGMLIETANSDGEGSVSLQMHSFAQEIREVIFNEKPDEDGVYMEKAGKQNPYVAMWFTHERQDGSYKLIGLSKVMFQDPEIEGSTKEDSTEFGSEEAEGIALHRQYDKARKITADSNHEDFDKDAFFEKLLQGAYEEEDEGEDTP